MKEKIHRLSINLLNGEYTKSNIFIFMIISFNCLQRKLLQVKRFSQICLTKNYPNLILNLNTGAAFIILLTNDI